LLNDVAEHDLGAFCVQKRSSSERRTYLMKPVVLAAALAVLCGAAALPSLATTTSTLAPADRYFGRLHLSVLCIRNSLKDLASLADAHPEEAQHVFDKAVLVEDSLMNWAGQFPLDPWIPKYTFNLAQLYGKLDIDDARTRRTLTLDWLNGTYPESEYAQLPRA
jgi:hypothetical protein